MCWACLGVLMVGKGAGQVLFVIPLHIPTILTWLSSKPYPDRRGLLSALDFFTHHVTVTRPVFRPAVGCGEAWLLGLGKLGHTGSKRPSCARFYRTARARALSRGAAELRRAMGEEAGGARGRVL